MRNQYINLEKIINQQQRKCYIDGCDSPASFNHLLQKNGLLNQIAEEGHIYKLVINKYKQPQVEFSRKGINKNFGYQGFCNYHDNQLFKPIEKKQIDFTSYKNQLLFSLRAFYNQRFQKERLLAFYLATKSIKSTQDIIPDTFFKDSINGLMSSLNDYEEIEKELFDDYNLNSENFYFKVIELPLLPICISSFFTYETINEIKQLFINKNNLNIPLTNIFINLIPYTNKSILIIGCQQKKHRKCKEFLSKFSSSNLELTLKNLSTTILNNIEDWVISPSFYKNNIKYRENEIIKIILEGSKHERIEPSINLFESNERVNKT